MGASNAYHVSCDACWTCKCSCEPQGHADTYFIIFLHIISCIIETWKRLNCTLHDSSGSSNATAAVVQGQNRQKLAAYLDIKKYCFRNAITLNFESLYRLYSPIHTRKIQFLRRTDLSIAIALVNKSAQISCRRIRSHSVHKIDVFVAIKVLNILHTTRKGEKFLLGSIYLLFRLMWKHRKLRWLKNSIEFYQKKLSFIHIIEKVFQFQFQKFFVIDLIWKFSVKIIIFW